MGLTLGGRYEVIKPISQGAFGQTFLAEDKHLPNQQYCVIKQLIPQIVNEVTIDLFNREAQALAKLGNHEQIPKFYASFREDNAFYLVQEFIDGHDLSKEIIAGKKLGESYVINLLQDIFEILAFVHQNGIIHRDIKPHNIIRRKDGKLVLIDFGGVKQIGTQWVKEKHSSVSVGVGTPGYMPSEQAHQKPKFSSDVYAVGMIAIQALTGIKPADLPEDDKTGEIRWQDQTFVSDALASVLNNMVRYDWRERYSSAGEALEAVKSLGRLVVSQSEQPKTVREWFYQGNQSLEVGKNEEAIFCYQKAIMFKPDFVNAWYNRGVALERINRYPEALASYNQVIKLQPDNPSGWHNRGVALVKLKRYSEAIASYDHAISLKSDLVEAWYARGWALCQLQRYAEGIASYDKALSLQPEYAVVWYTKGLALEDLHRYNEAIAAYNRAISIHPAYIEAWYKKGLALYHLKRYSEAIFSFDEALKLRPEYRLALKYRNLATSQLRR